MKHKTMMSLMWVLPLAVLALLVPAAPAAAQAGTPIDTIVVGPGTDSRGHGETVIGSATLEGNTEYVLVVSGEMTRNFSDGTSVLHDAFYCISSPCSSAGTEKGEVLYADTRTSNTVADPLSRLVHPSRVRPPLDADGTYEEIRIRPSFGGKLRVSTVLQCYSQVTCSGPGYTLKIYKPGAEPTPGGNLVTVANPQRKVEVQRNQSGWEVGRAGMKLVSGDRVHTGFKAGVTLNFPGSSRLFVGAMTIITLTKVEAGPEGVTARLLLKTGEVKAQVNRSTGAHGDFQVKTPTTTTSVRGTEFSVAYDGTATTVAVTESSVEVTSNSGEKVVVPAGMETRSTAKSVSPPVAIGKGFKSGGLSSAQALARMNGKLAPRLKRCKFGVVSNTLAPIKSGWGANFVIVGAKQGIKAKPKGTAKFRLKGKKLKAGNALARKINRGCR